MALTVNQVARMTGITLRTLRYYDQIGLLHPEHRSEAGYRLYGEGDLERLQEILLLREMDFSLEAIAGILHAPGYRREAALRAQAAYLDERAARYRRLAQLARDTLSDLKGEHTMNPEEKFEAFGQDELQSMQQEYEAEVRQRWGDTDAYRESRRRAKGYSKEDWARIQAEQQAQMEGLAACFKAGEPADGPRAQALVEEGRALIDRNFYPCQPAFMENLGEMYVADERFKATYDKLAEGLAEYYREAIRAYVKNAGS